MKTRCLPIILPALVFLLVPPSTGNDELTSGQYRAVGQILTGASSDFFKNVEVQSRKKNKKKDTLIDILDKDKFGQNRKNLTKGNGLDFQNIGETSKLSTSITPKRSIIKRNVDFASANETSEQFEEMKKILEEVGLNQSKERVVMEVSTMQTAYWEDAEFSEPIIVYDEHLQDLSHHEDGTWRVAEDNRNLNGLEKTKNHERNVTRSTSSNDTFEGTKQEPRENENKTEIVIVAGGNWNSSSSDILHSEHEKELLDNKSGNITKKKDEMTPIVKREIFIIPGMRGKRKDRDDTIKIKGNETDVVSTPKPEGELEKSEKDVNPVKRFIYWHFPRPWKPKKKESPAKKESKKNSTAEAPAAKSDKPSKNKEKSKTKRNVFPDIVNNQLCQDDECKAEEKTRANTDNTPRRSDISEDKYRTRDRTITTKYYKRATEFESDRTAENERNNASGAAAVDSEETVKSKVDDEKLKTGDKFEIGTGGANMTTNGHAESLRREEKITLKTNRKNITTSEDENKHDDEQQSDGRLSKKTELKKDDSSSSGLKHHEESSLKLSKNKNSTASGTTQDDDKKVVKSKDPDVAGKPKDDHKSDSVAKMDRNDTCGTSDRKSETTEQTIIKTSTDINAGEGITIMKREEIKNESKGINSSAAQQAENHHDVADKPAEKKKKNGSEKDGAEENINKSTARNKTSEDRKPNVKLGKTTINKRSIISNIVYAAVESKFPESLEKQTSGPLKSDDNTTVDSSFGGKQDKSDEPDTMTDTESKKKDDGEKLKVAQNKNNTEEEEEEVREKSFEIHSLNDKVVQNETEKHGKLNQTGGAGYYKMAMILFKSKDADSVSENSDVEKLTDEIDKKKTTTTKTVVKRDVAESATNKTETSDGDKDKTEPPKTKHADKVPRKSTGKDKSIWYPKVNHGKRRKKFHDTLGRVGSRTKDAWSRFNKAKADLSKMTNPGNKPKVQDVAYKSKVHGTANKPKVHGTANKPKVHGTANKPKVHGTANKPKVHGTANKTKVHGTANKPKVHGTANKPKVQETTNKPKSEDGQDSGAKPVTKNDTSVSVSLPSEPLESRRSKTVSETRTKTIEKRNVADNNAETFADKDEDKEKPDHKTKDEDRKPDHKWKDEDRKPGYKTKDEDRKPSYKTMDEDRKPHHKRNDKNKTGYPKVKLRKRKKNIADIPDGVKTRTKDVWTRGEKAKAKAWKAQNAKSKGDHYDSSKRVTKNETLIAPRLLDDEQHRHKTAGKTGKKTKTIHRRTADVVAEDAAKDQHSFFKKVEEQPVKVESKDSTEKSITTTTTTTTEADGKVQDKKIILSERT